MGDGILGIGDQQREPPAFPGERSLSAFPAVLITGQPESAQHFHEQCSLPFLLLTSSIADGEAVIRGSRIGFVLFYCLGQILVLNISLTQALQS